MLVEADPNNNPTAMYSYHPQYVDAVAVRMRDVDAHIYLHDANFNVTAVMGSAGAVVERYSYTPYGEVTVLDADFSVDPNGTDIDNEYMYTGRRLDPETGLQLNRNRFYHAPLGRWVNRDPIGYDGGTNNLYEYAGTNPLVRLDPIGRRFIGNGLPCPRCSQAFSTCSNDVLGKYAWCTSGIVVGGVAELSGCAALCAWAIPSGPGYPACVLACTAGLTGLTVALTLPHCELALNEGEQKCGAAYNRCAFANKKDCPCGENWRPDPN